MSEFLKKSTSEKRLKILPQVFFYFFPNEVTTKGSKCLIYLLLMNVSTAFAVSMFSISSHPCLCSLLGVFQSAHIELVEGTPSCARITTKAHPVFSPMAENVMQSQYGYCSLWVSAKFLSSSG